MDESEWLADRFEEHRARLRAVAYRMLGSLTATPSIRPSVSSSAACSAAPAPRNSPRLPSGADNPAQQAHPPAACRDGEWAGVLSGERKSPKVSRSRTGLDIATPLKRRQGRNKTIAPTGWLIRRGLLRRYIPRSGSLYELYGM